MTKQIQERRAVGRVEGIFRYPVKSMAGESLRQARIGWHGLAGDRRYAFLRLCSRSGLPWLSAREFPALLRYRAYLENPDAAGAGVPMVVTPKGKELEITSDALLKELTTAFGEDLRLLQLWRGTYDSMDISLLTLESLRWIAAAIGHDLEVARFRPNLLVEALSERRWPEERWVSTTLRFGEGKEGPRVRVARRDERCAIVNLDPTTVMSNPTVLREIVRQRRNLLGVYGSVERPGTIRVGDVIWISED